VIVTVPLRSDVLQAKFAFSVQEPGSRSLWPELQQVKRAVAAIRNDRWRRLTSGRSGVVGVTHIGVTNVAIEQTLRVAGEDLYFALKLANTFTDYYDTRFADFSAQPASTIFSFQPLL
jgi:hypothetical protein